MTAKTNDRPVKNENQKFTDKGVTETAFYYVLYWLSIFKYATQPQLQALPKSAGKKVATQTRLKGLVDTGYLKVLNPKEHYLKKIYTPRTKLINHLKSDEVAEKLKQEKGFNRKLIPPARKQTAKGDEIYNTDVFLQAIKKDNFHALFHGYFFTKDNTKVLPDGILILAEARKYQINLLEIEEKKDKKNWLTHLESKRANYYSVAQNEKTYHWWRITSKALGLPCPEKQDFKFKVLIIGEMETQEWGDGFEFRRIL